MPPLHFDITLLPTDSLHDDIVIELGEWRATGDTYWLANFAGSVSSDQHAARRVLIYGIDRWIPVIETPNASTLWLPLLVCDQCTTWLEVACQEGDAVVLSVGSSTVEGHTIDKALSPVMQIPHGWTIDSPKLSASTQAFIACLRQIQSKLLA